jgi:hypothetical protein
LVNRGVIGEHNSTLDLDEWQVGNIVDDQIQVYGLVDQKKESFFAGPFFPKEGQVVTALVTGQKYRLNRQKGTSGPRENNKKRKSGSPAESISQMKDAVTRQVARSVLTRVQKLQEMQQYGPNKLRKLPRCDSIHIFRDVINPRPDDLKKGLQKREKPHYTMLVSSQMATNAKRKEMGKYLEEFGKALQKENPNSNVKNQGFTCSYTDRVDKVMVDVFGAEKKKKSVLDDEEDEEEEEEEGCD